MLEIQLEKFDEITPDEFSRALSLALFAAKEQEVIRDTNGQDNLR